MLTVLWICFDPDLALLDRYMLFADYESYIAAQEKVSKTYAVSVISVLFMFSITDILFLGTVEHLRIGFAIMQGFVSGHVWYIIMPCWLSW